KPSHAALRALAAFCQSPNSRASVTIGAAENANGAKPNTVAAPSIIAARNGKRSLALRAVPPRGTSPSLGRPGGRLMRSLALRAVPPRGTSPSLGPPGGRLLTHPRRGARGPAGPVAVAVRLAMCTNGGYPHGR